MTWKIFTRPEGEIEYRLEGIEKRLSYLIRLQEKEMADISKLQADVTAQSTVIDSVVTLLEGLTHAIDDLKLHTEDPAAQAAIDALATQVEAQTAALSAAVTANTPATP